MSWDGSGNFSRTNGTHTGSTTWANSRDAGNNITASLHDTHDQDLADGIAACLTKNNETKPTAAFRPNANGTLDLGSSALRWANLYLSGFVGDGSGNELMKFSAAASAVNEFTVTNAATGSGPSIAATGGDTNIPATLSGKGTGAVILGQATSTDVRLAADQPLADSSGNELLKFTKAASAVNEMTLANAATGNAPAVSATGGDTNIGLTLASKGTGTLLLQTNSATAVSVSGAGEVNKPLQPAFLAFNSANDLNVSGAGTVAQIDFDTEVFDQGGDFASDTFTAPVAGRYHFDAVVRVEGLASATSIALQLVTSNRTYSRLLTAPPNSIQSIGLSVLADMDVNDTASVSVTVSGMAGDTADISGGSELVTYFSGALVC